MIEFKGIRYKNILSVGNNWVSIKFTNGLSSLIVGKNGVGKSTMIEALTFALYGKAFRKASKAELVNSVNGKGLICEIYFVNNGNQYVIKRGIKPDFCELYINGVLKKQDASVRDYQTYIETQVLQLLDEKTFRQIVVLGSTSYTPFMLLAAKQKRIVVEDLLDIGIYSDMADIAKTDLTEVSNEYRDISNAISLEESKLKLLNDRRLDNKKDYKSLIEQSKATIADNNKKLKILQDKISDIENKISNIIVNDSNLAVLNSEIDDKNISYVKLDHDIKADKKTFKFYHDNTVCPTCSQDIDKKFKDKLLTKVESDIEIKSHDLLQQRGDIEQLTIERDAIALKLNEIKELHNEKQDIYNQTSNITSLNMSLNNNIESLTNKSAESSDSLKGELSKVSEDIAKLKAQLSDASKQGQRLKYIIALLKDNGIRAEIIKTYVPIINQLIRKYLDIMEFYADFKFDENFKETIKFRGRDIYSYGMFSEGEKLRIDLAILFAWRELAKIKNSASTNLIIFDEIGDSSLDNEGFDSFMKVISSEREKQCTFIISHKPEGIENRVNTVYEFDKVKSFTVLKGIINNN